MLKRLKMLENLRSAHLLLSFRLVKLMFRFLLRQRHLRMKDSTISVRDKLIRLIRLKRTMNTKNRQKSALLHQISHVSQQEPKRQKQPRLLHPRGSSVRCRNNWIEWIRLAKRRKGLRKWLNVVFQRANVPPIIHHKLKSYRQLILPTMSTTFKPYQRNSRSVPGAFIRSQCQIQFALAQMLP